MEVLLMIGVIIQNFLILVYSQDISTKQNFSTSPTELEFDRNFDTFYSIPSRRSCDDHYRAGIRNEGVFKLIVGKRIFTVFCEFPNDGHGWMVFQKRFNGETDFYRDWNSYVNGFGDVTREHWLGLQLLHDITSSGSYRLRVDLEDWKGEQRYAEYSMFSIDDRENNYQIKLDGYSGNAGDSLGHHSYQPFSTKDRDNDKFNVKCAIEFHGAWWYAGCYSSNLNGRYQNASRDVYETGIQWNTWKKYYSMKRTVMKIRPN